MNEKSKIYAVIYVLVTSVTVLVMLTTSFELFNQKYLPAFMLAQKYALPLVVSAMAVAFLTFFEPERLKQKMTMNVMRVIMAITLGSFTMYMTTITVRVDATVVLYAVQWIVTFLATLQFFRIKKVTEEN